VKRRTAILLLGVGTLVLISVMLVRGWFFVKDRGGSQYSLAGNEPGVDPNAIRNANIQNRHIVDTAVSLVRSGDIVLRRGLGADSYMLAEMNRKDKSYSHCGIVMVENGYPFVYHSIGGEDNPDERLRRDSSNFFFSPLHNTDIAIIRYDYSNEKIEELRQVVYDYYKQRPKFDLAFDLKTDDELYCAEFIYKAVNKVMKDSLYIRTTSVVGLTFVGIDDLFLNEHAHIVWQIKFK
jgi:Permuted papain-like amidase enzyme, YaeF/YiiX, C92 family